MNISKAIEILNQLERTLAPTMAASGTDAIKLSIEALERVKALRLRYNLGIPYYLPGETKD